MMCAEFEQHSFVQVIFPHNSSDWAEYLDEASQTFKSIIEAIARYEKCLVVCDDIERVKRYLDTDNIEYVQYESNDTWARDCSVLSIKSDDGTILKDFRFNGWGGKFDATLDDGMSRALSRYYGKDLHSCDFVLEGGAVESNGDGLILTTTKCLLNPNRNPHLSKEQIERTLCKELGANKVLWLNSGYLAGDDTDSHIDTLARFCSKDTLCYVSCDDVDDEHYEELLKMRDELESFGENLKLIALPMPSAIYYQGKRLPATYANFLIINGAVLVPTYGDAKDEEALKTIATLFPSRQIIAIDSRVLIRQNGSLHCVTMQIYL